MVQSTSSCSFTIKKIEAEYIALAHGVKDVIWLRRLLQELGGTSYTHLYFVSLAATRASDV